MWGMIIASKAKFRFGCPLILVSQRKQGFSIWPRSRIWRKIYGNDSGYKALPFAYCPETSWPTTNSTFISISSFCARGAGNIAPLGSCADNGGFSKGAAGVDHAPTARLPATHASSTKVRVAPRCRSMPCIAPKPAAVCHERMASRCVPVCDFLGLKSTPPPRPRPLPAAV